MGRLFHLEPTRIANTDTIASLKGACSAAGRERVDVTFVDGRRETIVRSMDDLEWCTGTIIPAPPGYQVIQAFPPRRTGRKRHSTPTP